MILPTTYAAAFALMVISMVCWGSWANLFKIATPLRFELFYWDYTIGILAVVLVLGLTLGSFGSSGPSLFTDLHRARFLNIALAFAAGVIFNMANILLVAASFIELIFVAPGTN